MEGFEKVKAFLEEKRDEMVENLMEFVRIPSVSEDLPEVKKSLRYILDLADRFGFSAKAVLDERVGVIEYGEGPETLGILAHVDVVPPGSLEKWIAPPFVPEVQEGAVWGRGTLDDKGAVIASLYALRAVVSLGLPFQKKVQIILGTQEEVEWTDMSDYVKSFPLPEYGFTPDGEFPLCNIEKGIGGVELAFPLQAEPKTPGACSGKYTLLSIDAGVVNNIIPSSCTARLILHGPDENDEKEIRLTTDGTSVHACSPEKGDNAIVNMCKILKSLPLDDEKASTIVTLIADQLSDIYCGPIGVGERLEYYNGEFIHKNCMSPTMIRTVNGEVLLYMDMRIAYSTSTEEIIEGFEKLVGPKGGFVRGNTLEPATYIDRNLPFMKVFAEAYESACGLENEFTLAYGASYAKAMPNIVAWGPVFPGEEDTCHEENEHISIDSLMSAAGIYGEAIRQIALSSESFI